MRAPCAFGVWVCVFITTGPITKLFAVGGGGEWTTCAMIDRRMDDMCYDRRRAEACVDESAHHARCVCYVCVFITAGPITKLFAARRGGEEESGRHVL